jgi:hypothetical protein
MAKVAISINEVLRDFIGHFIYTYEKYIVPELEEDGKKVSEIEIEDVTSLNLMDHFEFEDINTLNTFLYKEAPLEIFGHADLMSDGLMIHFNRFLSDIKDDEEHEIELVSREVDKSIPSTFFFLSKTACLIDSIRFVKNNEDEWGDADVLVTANPQALLNKPKGKLSVKVKSSYNKEIKSDYEIDTLLDFINDEDFRNKILNTKITSYEEL